MDPITADYPALTPFQFASNTPISAIDIDGLEAYVATETKGTGHVFLVVKTEQELIVYTYGRYGRVDWNQTSGEGILKKLIGGEAINYINTELTRMDASFYRIKDVTADNLKGPIEYDYYHGNSSVTTTEGKVIDKYNLFSSNCSTHACDWLQDAGTSVFDESNFFYDYKEDFVIPSSLQKYLNKKVEQKPELISNANEEIRQILANEKAKSSLENAGLAAETSGSSGRSSGGATNSSSAGSASGRNTSSGSSTGAAAGSSASGQGGASSGASAGSSSGNGFLALFIADVTGLKSFI